MVEALTLFAIAVPFFLGMLGLRLGVFRGIILELQGKTEERSNDAYNRFEAILYARYKKDRNPEEALDHAAQYHSWERRIDELNQLFDSNKRQIVILDVVGFVLTVAYMTFVYVFQFGCC